MTKQKMKHRVIIALSTMLVWSGTCSWHYGQSKGRSEAPGHVFVRADAGLKLVAHRGHFKEENYRPPGRMEVPDSVTYSQHVGPYKGRLPPHFKVSYSVRARRSRAVVGGPQRGPMTSVLLIDRTGEDIRQVVGLPSSTEWIDVKWSPDGTRLGLACGCGRPRCSGPIVSVGTVDLKACRFRPIYSLHEWGIYEQTLLWAKQKLLFVCHAEDKNHRQANLIVKMDSVSRR